MAPEEPPVFCTPSMYPMEKKINDALAVNTPVVRVNVK